MNQQQPIRSQLMRIMLVASGLVALVILCGISIFEYVAYRQGFLDRLTTLGEVVAANSKAALAFDNAEDASNVLMALAADSSIDAAAIYTADRRIFAVYPPKAPLGTFPALPETGTSSYVFSGGSLRTYQRIELQGRQLGTLYLRANLAALYERLALFALIALLMIAITAPAAYVISRRLQRQISRPILTLAETALAVSHGNDYSVRAAPAFGFEKLAQLTSAFNNMLATTQEAQGKLQIQLSRLALLQRITRAIGERQDLPSIFQALLGTLEDNLPMDFACACIHDAAVPRLTISKVGGRSGPLGLALQLEEGVELPIDTNGLSTCLRGQLVYEPDTRELPFPFPQRLASGGLYSLVAAPMLAESRVFGVLICARAGSHAFSSADCEFLRQLSEHVALASHQAQLHSSLQLAYDELRVTQHTVMQQERLRALGQMASGIAHDINNAISPVSLYTESLLEREPNLSERTRSYLVTIQRAIDDVAQTVARMREFYRTREPQLQLSRVSLNRLVEQVLHLTKARWSDLPQQLGIGMQVVTELEPTVPDIMGAESEIRDALTNLIFNAVDAMPEGGTLTLRTRVLVEKESGGQQVQVQVSDTGVGMSEEIRRRCLEPFYTTKGERGTGLGLAMVYGMVQRHSAELDLQSAPGEGTTFSLTFASAGSVATDVQVQRPSGREPLPALRVLLVDDDPVLIKSLRDILEGDGHQITAAAGGQAGIDVLGTSQEFDVVITDLGMPYVDGRKVAEAAKTLRTGLPVIMLTGWGRRLIAENEVPPHVDRVLSKPPRIAELRSTLNEVTRARGAAVA